MLQDAPIMILWMKVNLVVQFNCSMRAYGVKILHVSIECNIFLDLFSWFPSIQICMEQNIDVNLGIMGWKHWNLDGERSILAWKYKTNLLWKWVPYFRFFYCVVNSDRRNNIVDSLVANGPLLQILHIKRSCCAVLLSTLFRTVHLAAKVGWSIF